MLTAIRLPRLVKQLGDALGIRRLPRIGGAARPRPFNLLRWFGVTSFVMVSAAAVGCAAMLSHFLAAEMLAWDAVATAEFVVTVAETQSAYGNYPRKTGVAELLGGATPDDLGVTEAVARASTAEFYDHMKALPDATFIRVYATDRSVVWHYARPGHEDEPENPHEEHNFLEDAFKFKYTGTYEVIGRWDHHMVRFPSGKSQRYYFVENYVPLYDAQDQVVAVVELYKEPARLLGSIRRGQILVWVVLLSAGALIYLALFWLVRRAAIVMADQQERLVDAETMAAIGEMSLAVAHGIRNPLAAIRTSAELIKDKVAPESSKQVQDIIAQADRLSQWLWDLLVFSRPAEGEFQKVDLVTVLRQAIENFAAQMTQANVDLWWPDRLAQFPPVIGNPQLFLQALNSVIANALEAMPRGGTLSIGLALNQGERSLTVIVADTGSGMSAAQLAQAFRPFKTSKARGLGIGLTLVKRAIERSGGSVRIESRENSGTQVKLTFRVAR